MSKYIIEFSKTGTICYTSHLDLMRIFKRAFKRTGIALAYSQGFNPHPKMGFAQPLSLGYWGIEEYIEFETAEGQDADGHEALMQRLAAGLPEGIDLKRCLPADHLTKTLAAHTVAAEYMIAVPVRRGDAAPAGDETAAAGERAPVPGQAAVVLDSAVNLSDPRSMWHSLMDLDEISVWKRQKKKKEPKLVDIKSMIREITFSPVTEADAGAGKAGADGPAGADGTAGAGRAVLYINAVLDCGSDSNLSPELVIGSVLKRFGITTDRSEISVMRKKILFDQPLDI